MNICFVEFFVKYSEFCVLCCPYASAGDEWSEVALDDFDRLTHSARWKPLQAKLCSYSHSDEASWPSVKLYDIIQGKVSENSLLQNTFAFKILLFFFKADVLHRL